MGVSLSRKSIVLRNLIYSIFFILGLKAILFMLYKIKGYYFLIGSFNQDDLNLCLNIILLITITLSIVLNIKKSRLKRIIFATSTMCLVTIIFTFNFFNSAPAYFNFTSEENKTVIIEENGWLFSIHNPLRECF